MSYEFLQRGKDVHDQIALDDAEREASKRKHAARRFYLPPGKSATVTFLDGGLTPDGLLDVVGFYEHDLFLNGRRDNFFVCVGRKRPCLICQSDREDRERKPYHISFLTVIDHSEWTDKEGKLRKNERRLFAAKGDPLKMLQHMAKPRGGVVGWTVNIARIGDTKTPRVGNQFDFLIKTPPDQFMAQYGLKPEDIRPFDYKDLDHDVPDEYLIRLGIRGPKVVGAADVQHVKSGIGSISPDEYQHHLKTHL